MTAHQVVVIVPADSIYPQRESVFDMEQVRAGTARVIEAARAAMGESN